MEIFQRAHHVAVRLGVLFRRVGGGESAPRFEDVVGGAEVGDGFSAGVARGRVGGLNGVG